MEMKLTIDKRAPNFFHTSESQVGYKNGESTIDNIILVIQRIERMKEAELDAEVGAFLDINRAYPSLKHEKLIKILLRRLKMLLIHDESKELIEVVIRCIEAGYRHATLTVGKWMIRIIKGVI